MTEQDLIRQKQIALAAKRIANERAKAKAERVRQLRDKWEYKL